MDRGGAGAGRRRAARAAFVVEGWAAGIAAASLLLGGAMAKWTDAVAPMMDAFAAAASVVARMVEVLTILVC